MPRYALAGGQQPAHVKIVSKDDPRTFSCPYCGAEMFIAGGESTQYRKHFRHHSGDSCYDYEQAGETRRHLDGKAEAEYWLLDADWANEIDIETNVGPTRPDLRATVGGDTVAIELQSSSLTASELKQRTRDRTGEGLYTLWLFDAAGRYRTESVSSSGNSYISYKTAEQAYLSMADQPPGAYVHYFDIERRTPLFAQYYRLFDDHNGGWPETRTSLGKVETFTTPNGYRLATVQQAVPEETGDTGQARLF